MRTHKNCNGCKQVLPVGSFYVQKRRGPNHYSSRCKDCNAKAAREWSASDHGRMRRRDTAFPKLLATHGVTVEWYEQQFAKQGGVCAICGEVETRHRGGIPTRLSVDHCHATGVVRGLLCTRCNSAIGLLADDYRRARAATDYLIAHLASSMAAHPRRLRPGEVAEFAIREKKKYAPR